MQVDKILLIDLALRLLLIDLHFFIQIFTIQIGVIVQVCYTPLARLPQSFIHLTTSPSVCNLYILSIAQNIPRVVVPSNFTCTGIIINSNVQIPEDIPCVRY